MWAHLGIARKQVRLRSLRVGVIKLQAVLPVNVTAEQLREPREHRQYAFQLFARAVQQRRAWAAGALANPTSQLHEPTPLSILGDL